MLRWRRGLRMVVRRRVELDLVVCRGGPERVVPIVADLAARRPREQMGQRAQMGNSGRWAGGGMTSL